MRWLLGPALAVLVLGWLVAAVGQVWPAPYRDPVISIAEFRGNKAAAVSFTFDDGLQAHRDIAAPVLAAHGIHGTFYVIAGLAREHKADPAPAVPRLRYGEGALSWEEIREISDLGHEIGNHSLTHPFLPRLTPAQLQREVQESARLIAAHLGAPPQTLACPYNEMNSRVRREVLRTHVAIREPWTDWGGPAFTTARANACIDEAIARRQWLIPMIHGIDGGFLPLSSRVLQENAAYVAACENDLWIDTYANVALYRRQRASTSVQVLSVTPRSAEFVLRAASLPVVASVPLTVVLRVDDDQVTNLHVTRGETELPARAEGSTILVEVSPDPAPVTVTWE